MKYQFTKGYGIKLLLIALLLLCFVPPISMIKGIVFERAGRSDAAKEEVIDSWGGRCTVSGPYLSIPAVREYTELRSDGSKSIMEERRKIILFPEVLEISAESGAEERQRGIYTVPVFLMDLDLSGSFDLSRIEGKYDEYELRWDSAELRMEFGSLKGIRGIESALLGEKALSFEPAAASTSWGSPIGAEVDLSSLSAEEGPRREIPYRIFVHVGGGGSISFMPVARQTEAEIVSDWPSPSFFGSLLPDERDYSEEGFDASWSISHLSRNLPSTLFLSALGTMSAGPMFFGVKFFQSEDPYPRNERSIKYAWLFLLVPFLTFFLFEVIRTRRIHPVQYLLAGSADIVFYLLLISLSEHILFDYAYLVSAVSVTLLLAAYGVTVLGGKREALLLGTILTLGYGYLYFVLRSEDYALLLGSVGLFAVLALVMFLTRRINWYRKE